jgi:hypothetical protein
VTSEDTDDKRSRTTNHTIKDLPMFTTVNANSTMDLADGSLTDVNGELVQQILRKFKLQCSDFMFFKNILRILEIEQREMNV